MNKHSLPIAAALAALISFAVGGAAPEPRSATLPIALDHNRMTVEVIFQGPSGALKAARAWVDSGGTDLVMAEPLARDLGIDFSARPAGSGQDAFATKVPVPATSLGGIALDTEGMFVSVQPGRLAMPGIHQADCVLPARCLRRLHVVFDYPARQLVVARPGALTPRGAAVPCRVNPETGLFMVETVIDGEKASLGVDNGSAGTWISQTRTKAWLERHPDWPKAIGAAGSTNFFGFPFETRGDLICLPNIAIGAVPVGETAVLGLPQGLFDWYSKKSAGTVIGFLGADAIARFRVEVDFPGGMTWWEAGPAREVRDLDIVGITLSAGRDGSFTVAGVVSQNGQPSVQGVQRGDKLLSVDALDATNAPMGKVIDALRGKPGDTRVLRLSRAGKTFSVTATVVHLP